jgi:hypothetical protein
VNRRKIHEVLSRLSILITLAFGLAVQSHASAAEKVSFCQLTVHPHLYVGKLVMVDVDVKMYKHGVSISNSECPKQSLLLIASQQSSQTESVSRFYRFLAQHRQSRSPVVAKIAGRLVKGTEHGFVLRRDFDFDLDSIQSFSTDERPKPNSSGSLQRTLEDEC